MKENNKRGVENLCEVGGKLWQNNQRNPSFIREMRVVRQLHIIILNVLCKYPTQVFNSGSSLYCVDDFFKVHIF